MSLLMQALRRAETAKKNLGTGEPAVDPGAPAAAPASPPGVTEMTLESKEPTADELAAAEREKSAADLAAGEGAPGAPAAPPEPVDYFSGEVLPPRAPYVAPEAPVAPAAQGFDPERGAGAGSVAPAPSPHPHSPQDAPAPRGPALGAAEPAPQQAAEARSAARAVFAAKQNVRGRRPLIIAALGLMVLGAGAAVFYFMLLPAAPPAAPVAFSPAATGVLVPAPGTVADPATVVVVPGAVVATPAPVFPSAASAVPVAPTPPIAALPMAAAPAAAPAAVAVPAAPARAVRPAPDPAFGAASTAASEPGASAPRVRVVQARTVAAQTAAPIEVRRMEATRNINPALVGAYQSFVSGDAAAARSGYQRVLQQEPDNRDALLGMAAIAVNRGQGAEAGAFYARLLEIDPSDPQAAAGMAALQRGDPNQTESRLKGVLAANPDTGAALFALGNLYAEQARWPDAQMAYFRAVGSEPANAGYAFNLAVSLDKLNQQKLALDYYRRALQLSQKGGSTVNQATTAARIRQLELAAPR